MRVCEANVCIVVYQETFENAELFCPTVVPARSKKGIPHHANFVDAILIFF